MPETPIPVPSIWASLGAELLGTATLVFGVVSAAVFGAGFMDGAGGLNLGFLGVALALGLTVVGGAYAWGPISGGHFNPAVTLGLAVASRFAWGRVGAYVLAQVIGGICGSTLVLAIAAGGPNGFLESARRAGFASTGWGELSPGGFSLGSAFLVETATTGIFVAVIIAVTGVRGSAALAPLAIGLSLALMALIAIPISNGSFNPARSIATAIYGGSIALDQLWMSLAAPVLGGAIAGLVANLISRRADRAATTKVLFDN